MKDKEDNRPDIEKQAGPEPDHHDDENNDNLLRCLVNIMIINTKKLVVEQCKDCDELLQIAFS